MWPQTHFEDVDYFCLVALQVLSIIPFPQIIPLPLLTTSSFYSWEASVSKCVWHGSALQVTSTKDITLKIFQFDEYTLDVPDPEVLEESSGCFSLLNVANKLWNGCLRSAMMNFPSNSSASLPRITSRKFGSWYWTKWWFYYTGFSL